ncbi:MAG TPA: undecaprenyl-phosphate glucose phosphotransferase [Anaerolineae bacterium]|nr:undecaprenyl-phosphate glucose phosphotransferase [Anaerolineae bacterium]HQI86987.1 undecaprenyl-phosphate glucose phosphotransferase [Anaerolineae bacterium]
MRAERANRIFVVYLVLTDIAMAALAFGLAYFLRMVIPFPDPAEGMRPFSEYVPMLFIHVVSILAVCFFTRLYNLQRVSRVDEFYAILSAAVVGTLMGVALASLSLRDFVVGQDYSRAMVGYAWLLSTLLLMAGRLFNSWLRQFLIRHGWGRKRVLIVGTGDIARMILQKITWSPELGYDVVGIVSFHETEQTTLLQAPVVGAADHLGQSIDAHAADEVIIALPEETSHDDILWLISECERGRVTIRVYPDLFQIMAGPVSIGEMGGIPMLTVRDIALTGWRRSAKRLMDIVGSAAALIVLSPLMIVTAILIKLESPGPVFFVQERMGLDAKPFPILKFRSMRADAEKHGTWTAENDPRRTKIGTLLRKLNIDEFPQFINILLGHMSLVGPRPEQPFYVEQFRRSIPRYMDRHREKAGLTGWAQVNGYRQDTSIIERTKYDLWYIENWSLLLDIKIIIRTVLQFFRSPNAY